VITTLAAAVPRPATAGEAPMNGITQSTALWYASRATGVVSLLLLTGVVLFSGSLYALAISGVRMLGAVTPFGGLAFIAAWILLAYWLLTANA